jgi:hypothetical protein
MLLPRRFNRLIQIGCILFLLSPGVVRGQAEEFAEKGRLAGLEPGVIWLKSHKNPRAEPLKIKFVKPGDKAVFLKGKGSGWSFSAPLSVSITGELSPSQVTPGMLVKLRAIVNEEGTVTSEVSEVTALLDPTKGESAGLFPDQANEKIQGEGTPYLVKGIVLFNRKGVLTLNVGVKTSSSPKRRVTARMTDLTTVKVESENLGRARIGDEIEVTGVQVDGREIAAERVVVTLRRGGKSLGSSSTDTAKTKPELKKEAGTKKAPAAKNEDADNQADDDTDEGEKKKKKGKTVIVN